MVRISYSDEIQYWGDNFALEHVLLLMLTFAVSQIVHSHVTQWHIFGALAGLLIKLI